MQTQRVALLIFLFGLFLMALLRLIYPFSSRFSFLPYVVIDKLRGHLQCAQFHCEPHRMIAFSFLPEVCAAALVADVTVACSLGAGNWAEMSAAFGQFCQFVKGVICKFRVLCAVVAQASVLGEDFVHIMSCYFFGAAF